MKYCFILFTLLITQQAKSQEKVTIARDTIVYRSGIIRNNLAGQHILFRTDSGTMYRMLQDGLPCWSPVKPKEAVIPNPVSIPQPKMITRVVPREKPGSLPKNKEPRKRF